MNVDIKTISEFVVADHFKLIGIILIGILNHVKKTWMFFKFKWKIALCLHYKSKLLTL